MSVPNSWNQSGDSTLGAGIYAQVENCEFTPVWGFEPPAWNVFSVCGQPPKPARGFVTSKTASRMCDMLNPHFSQKFKPYLQPAPGGVIGYEPTPPKWFLEYPGIADRADGGEVAIALCNYGIAYTVDLLKRNLGIS